MTHDPLCAAKNDPDPKCHSCHLIDKVRADMLAKCIAAVEEVHSPIQHGEDTYCRGCADAAYDEFSFTWPCPVVTSVRALQEKPTPPPLPSSVGVPEKRWFR